MSPAADLINEAEGHARRVLECYERMHAFAYTSRDMHTRAARTQALVTKKVEEGVDARVLAPLAAVIDALRRMDLAVASMVNMGAREKAAAVESQVAIRALRARFEAASHSNKDDERRLRDIDGVVSRQCDRVAQDMQACCDAKAALTAALGMTTELLQTLAVSARGTTEGM